MNALEHKAIVSRGISFLPLEARDYWTPVAGLMEEASAFPDVFWAGEKSNPEYLKKYPDWRDYIMIPVNGKMINCHSSFDPFRLEETYSAPVAFLMNSDIELMHKGNKEKAAKFAGVLSHIIGDSGQAAHVCDSALIAALFQKEDDCYLIHTFIENNPKISYPETVEYTPVLLGCSAEEAQWRLVKKIQTLKKQAMKVIAPIMTAGIAGDWEKAGIYAGEMVLKAAFVFADYLYTLHQLAFGEAKMECQSVFLTNLEPDAYLCDGMFNFMPQKNFIPGPDAYHSLPLDIGMGAQTGYALLPDLRPGFTGDRIAYIDFAIPENIFSTLSFSYGLNRNGGRNDTGAIFEVFGNGEKIWESEVFDIATPPQNASIGLSKDINKIRIQVKDARKDAFETKFFYPCCIEPQLQRRV